MNDRTVCESCYSKNRRKNKNNTLIQNENISPQEQRKIGKVNTNKNNRTLLVGPGFLGKLYRLLKIHSRTPDEDFYIITKSSPELCSKSKIKKKGLGEEKKPLNDYENAMFFWWYYRLNKLKIYRSVFHKKYA